MLLAEASRVRRLVRVLGPGLVTGGTRTNGRGRNIGGWITTAVMCLAAVALVVATILG